MKNNKKFIFFGAWIGTLLVLVGIVNYLSNHNIVSPPAPPPPPPPMDDGKWRQVMSRAVDEPRGDRNAPYTVVEFGDFCCPQCGAMHKTIENLPNAAPVDLYFINRPFPQLKDHKYAVQAAEAGFAAAAQGKFWPMFEQLYGHQKDLEPGFYEQYADAAGLDGAALRKDVESGKYLQQVTDSYKFCDAIGFQLTPTIVIRDNKAGTYKVAAGRDDINKLLAGAPWVKAPAGPAVAKG